MKTLFIFRLLSFAFISLCAVLSFNAQTSSVQSNFANGATTTAAKNQIVANADSAAQESKTRIAKSPNQTSSDQTAAAAGAQTQVVTPWKYERPAAKERFNRYVNRTVGPFTLLGIAIPSAFQRAGDSPEEWEPNFRGYARQFGSNFGINAVEQTVVYGLDEAFRIDSRFYKKGKGTKPSARVANAVLSAVTARKPNGKRIVGFPRFAGIFSSNIIATTTWFPERFSYQDGLRQSTYSIGFNVGFNLLREFVFPSKRK